MAPEPSDCGVFVAKGSNCSYDDPGNMFLALGFCRKRTPLANSRTYLLALQRSGSFRNHWLVV
jgi:hypothetical protein